MIDIDSSEGNHLNSSGFNYLGVLLSIGFAFLLSVILWIPHNLCVSSGLIDINTLQGFTTTLAFYYLPHVVCGFFAGYLSRHRRILHAFAAGMLYLLVTLAFVLIATLESGGSIPVQFLLPIVPFALVGGWLAPVRTVVQN